MGYFNAILANEEKLGGITKPQRSMMDILDFVDSNHLSNVVPSNGLFTWTNKRNDFSRILERLDRFFLGP